MEYSEMKSKAADFFKSYAKNFNQSLENNMDWETMRMFYAEEFIAANPQGVKTGELNGEMKNNMDKGFDYYRSIGTKEMQCENVEITVLNDIHAVAYTKWNSIYLKNDKEIEIPFENHYLLQFRDGQPVIFGWITGDEGQLLKDKGII